MNAAHQRAAALLRAAYAGAPIDPLRDFVTPEDVDAAYSVQSINTKFWVEQGRRIVGRKIGLTAEAVQRQLGVDQPDFGVLFSDMQIADGGVLSAAHVIQPKAEAEVALVLGRDVFDLGATAETIMAAVDYAVAAIEIVDSRIADWKITFADTVADNGSSAFFVLGREKRKLAGLDLYTCGMALEINDKVASVGAGAACLGHPLKAAEWLARALADRGEPLRAGDIILTGALGPMVAINPGSKVRAQIGGLGDVSFSFEGAR
ncbi:MAG: fumarylacetoacetate hydrolase family protein [Hyphomonadaceae bacterium JAD_PAG50586_4]|nr:MAG: fumarylacetoacetate hydrolase family protein [Hyphomonadaceae bacterium JAD_PAG50586_4]